MKILLIGNGAREHAIAERIGEHAELYAVMSKKNPGIAKLSKQFWLRNIEKPDEVIKAIAGFKFDLAFASPDAVLAAGVSDALANAGIPTVSPMKNAARIEWDKKFMRELMEKFNIEGRVKHRIATSINEARSVIREFGEVALKPIGLTGGKGVRVSGDHFNHENEAISYVEEVLRKDGKILVEEKAKGEEFSLQAFSDGTNIATMPPVQDHKRAFEGDKGPNTGGMGSYSTSDLLPFLTKKDIEEAAEIIKKTIAAMKENGTTFVGVLYGQFMATRDGVRVIEFNSRFGDPEAMNVLGVLETPLPEILASMAEGKLKMPKFSNKATVVKYIVPEGYPDNPIGDSEVSVNEAEIRKLGAKIYHASVYEKNGKIFTTKSRAFGILGAADSLSEAERISEDGCRFITGRVWYRKDIGTKELIDKRIRRMKEIRKI